MGLKSWFNKTFGANIEFDMVSTKGGDTGKTGLYSGERLFKNDIHFEVLGDIDELNAYLGIVRNQTKDKNLIREIDKIQGDLIEISSQIATSPESEHYPQYNVENKIIELETVQKEKMKDLYIPNYFVHYGADGSLSAHFDFAARICRRAERRVVDFILKLDFDFHDAKLIQKYINRLSDFLWVCARKYKD